MILRPVLALALALPACANATTTDDEGLGEAFIFGGELEPPGSPVSQRTVLWTVLATEGKTGCSASILDDSHALTAMHCLISGPVPDDSILVFADRFSPDAEIRPVTGMFRRPDRADIAVITYSGGLPAGFTPVVLAQGTRVEPGTPVVQAGYGRTGPSPEGRGILRSTQSEISEVRAESRDYFTFSPGHSFCSGDSGGPDYVKVEGELRQLGVHVSGDCDSSSRSTDVRHFIDWIRSTGAQPLVDPEPVDADQEL